MIAKFFHWLYKFSELRAKRAAHFGDANKWAFYVVIRDFAENTICKYNLPW